jgi:hypothetical protein
VRRFIGLRIFKIEHAGQHHGTDGFDMIEAVLVSLQNHGEVGWLKFAGSRLSSQNQRQMKLGVRRSLVRLTALGWTGYQPSRMDFA